MKPRRWYSSPEVNPSPTPNGALPFTSLIHLAYTARTYRQQGSIIKLTPVELQQEPRGQNPQAPATSTVVLRIDAA
ncbi:MAG: hypothetical protein WCI67_17915 [Chloroflexales bacterium]